MVAKEEIPRAFHVLLVAPPQRAVLSVPLVHQASSETMLIIKKFVPSVQLDLHKVKQTKPVVFGVQRAKKHRQMLPAFVANVIWENSTQLPAKIVYCVQSVSTKMAKVKQPANIAMQIPT